MYCNRRILLIRWTSTIIATVTLLMATTTTTTFSSALAMPQSNHHPTKKVVVVVSGAGGQTGQSLFRKLLARPEEFTPFGIVRSEQSKKALLESGGVPQDSVLVADVTNAKEVQDAVQTAIASASVGEKEDQEDVVPSSFAFCICTSAKPVPSAEVNPDTGRPIFSFPNGDPEVVDWMGQKNQIDACPPGSHVVICSTMGGTNPDHPLNNLGRKTNDDGTTSGGMIVQWKRKAEVYLMEQAPKLKYTIVHPGGLTNDPGGERELVVGVDDETTGTDSRSIPREDVAQVMLEALRYPEQYAGGVSMYVPNPWAIEPPPPTFPPC